MKKPTRVARIGLAAALLVAAALLGSCFLGPGPAKVTVKFDLAGGDNNFAATVYVQEIESGATTGFPYDPHTPSITISLPKPGKYVFYARLVEAPDDYHYGYTSEQPVAYGHMTRGGVGQPPGLVALSIKAGGRYKAYINDFRATLPERDKPVTVPWYEEQP